MDRETNTGPDINPPLVAEDRDGAPSGAAAPGVAPTASHDDRAEEAEMPADQTDVDLNVMGRKMGRLAHQIIADLAAADERRPTIEQILRIVCDHPVTGRAKSHFLAARQELTVNTALYFRLFALSEDWVLVGSEVPGPGARFDLVWEHQADGQVLADELKTGRHQATGVSARLRDQLERQRVAGVELWESRFAGVRLCSLSAPGESVTVLPDGSRRPVEIKAAW